MWKLTTRVLPLTSGRSSFLTRNCNTFFSCASLGPHCLSQTGGLRNQKDLQLRNVKTSKGVSERNVSVSSYLQTSLNGLLNHLKTKKEGTLIGGTVRSFSSRSKNDEEVDSILRQVQEKAQDSELPEKTIESVEVKVDPSSPIYHLVVNQDFEFSHFDGIVMIVIPSLESAERFPLLTLGRGEVQEKSSYCSHCEKYTKKPVLISTYNPQDLSLFREYPLVVDATRCYQCQAVSLPYALEETEIKRILQTGVQNAKLKKKEIAEFCFRRVANSIPNNFFFQMNLANFYYQILSEETSQMNYHQMISNLKELRKYSKYIVDSARIVHVGKPSIAPPGFWKRPAVVAKKFLDDFESSSYFYEAHLTQKQSLTEEQKQECISEIAENKVLLSIRKLIELHEDKLNEEGNEGGNGAISIMRDLTNKLAPLIEKISPSSSSYPKTQLLYSSILASISERQKATEILLHLFENYKHSIDVSKELTEIAISNGDLTLASQALEIALRFYPQDHSVLAHGLLIYSLEGKKSKVEEIVSKLKSLGKESLKVADFERALKKGEQENWSSLQILQYIKQQTSPANFKRPVRHRKAYPSKPNSPSSPPSPSPSSSPSSHDSSDQKSSSSSDSSLDQTPPF